MKAFQTIILEEAVIGSGMMNKMELSGISCIDYKNRVARGWSYSIKIKREGLDYFLHAKFDDPENSYEPAELMWEGEKYAKIIKSFFERIVRVFDNNDVLSWAGFDGYDPEALDGWSFNLDIDFENGEHLTAEGDNSFPSGYSEVKREFNYLINEVISIHHKKGGKSL
ncbi:MAG: hypothetical protein ACOX1F_01590 [Erysipelotrichaceae bacterium]|jgi:hypothetical protein